jgi:hypothetical protein
VISFSVADESAPVPGQFIPDYLLILSHITLRSSRSAQTPCGAERGC